MRKVRIFVAVLVMLLAACGSGGAVSGGMSCTKSSGTNGLVSCSGTLDQLSGDKTLSFDMHSITSGNSAHLKITVLVKSGAVTVSFRNSGGKTISGDATGANPLSLDDTVFVDSSGHARIDLDSEHGISMEVQYAAEFTG